MRKTNKTHMARERNPLEMTLDDLPRRRAWVRALVHRLSAMAPLPEGASILDLGAASGGNVLALRELGYEASGVEPWDEARRNARQLGNHHKIPLDVRAGTAEDIPFEGEVFDAVIANSVLEHVADPDASLAEIRRVLKPGGVFWFSAASAVCPRQGEIRGFPLFGWYPDPMKKSIMRWAAKNRPELVGHTSFPALHWFTPKTARELLARHGFGEVRDRWDMRQPGEGGVKYRLALGLIQRFGPVRLAADLWLPCCAYGAVKLDKMPSG